MSTSSDDNVSLAIASPLPAPSAVSVRRRIAITDLISATPEVESHAPEVPTHPHARAVQAISSLNVTSVHAGRVRRITPRPCVEEHPSTVQPSASSHYHETGFDMRAVVVHLSPRLTEAEREELLSMHWYLRRHSGLGPCTRDIARRLLRMTGTRVESEPPHCYFEQAAEAPRDGRETTFTPQELGLSWNQYLWLIMNANTSPATASSTVEPFTSPSTTSSSVDSFASSTSTSSSMSSSTQASSSVTTTATMNNTSSTHPSNSITTSTSATSIPPNSNPQPQIPRPLPSSALMSFTHFPSLNPRYLSHLHHISSHLSPSLDEEQHFTALALHAFILSRPLLHGHPTITREALQTASVLRRSHHPNRGPVVRTIRGVLLPRTGLVNRLHDKSDALRGFVDSNFSAGDVGLRWEEWFWFCVPGAPNPFARVRERRLGGRGVVMGN